MTKMLDRLQSVVSGPEFTRRRFIGRVVKGSAALTAAIAGVAGPAVTNAQAYAWGCCNLLYSFCSTASQHRCPCCSSCRNHYTWYCTDSVSCRSYGCSECYDCSCSYGWKLCNCC
jgi:hypothetical protein